MLVTTLKQFKTLKSVNLSKFVSVCMDLNLLQFLPSALRRLGKQHMLVPHYGIKNIQDLIFIIEPGNTMHN